MTIAQIQKELIRLWDDLRTGDIAPPDAQLRLTILRTMLEVIDLERRIKAMATWKA